MELGYTSPLPQLLLTVLLFDLGVTVWPRNKSEKVEKTSTSAEHLKEAALSVVHIL